MTPETTAGVAPRRLKATRRAVSLRTLAEHLRLSPTVISRVLNASPGAEDIPAATQERIFAAAREFNYRPNYLARSLQRGHTMMVGVLVPEVSEGYAAGVLAGVEKALLGAGYMFILASHHHSEDILARSIGMLEDRSVDGLVAIDTPFEYTGSLPLVTVSSGSRNAEAVCITLNHRHGVQLAMEHLVGLGHRRLAIIKGQSFSSDTAKRWAAIQETAGDLGLVLHPQLVAELEGDAPTHEPGYQATLRLLAGGEPFTALFAFNDVSAIGAVRALREAGRRVPEDVSVVGFDDIQSANFQTPRLTTVRQPLHAMGRLAAETLLGRIEHHESPPAVHEVVLEPELVVRESTAAPLGS